MNEYNLIYESLCEAYNNGEITKEFAEEVNDLAYNKYVTESIFKMFDDKVTKKNKDKNFKNKMNQYNKRMNEINNTLNRFNDTTNKKVIQLKNMQ